MAESVIGASQEIKTDSGVVKLTKTRKIISGTQRTYESSGYQNYFSSDTTVSINEIKNGGFIRIYLNSSWTWTNSSISGNGTIFKAQTRMNGKSYEIATPMVSGGSGFSQTDTAVMLVPTNYMHNQIVCGMFTYGTAYITWTLGGFVDIWTFANLS